MNFEHIKNDFKQLFREPIMLFLFFLPVIIFVLFKVVILLIIPRFKDYLPFEPSDYYEYVLAFTLVLVPSMLSIVTGFLMLDERDGHITELMSITPLGRGGYLFNRLSFSFIATAMYTFIGYFILGIYKLPLPALFLIAILLGLFSMTVSLILFVLAPDKVKGLTYAKGLNMLMLFTLTDLLETEWLIRLSKLFPTYWITQVIQKPQMISIFSMALLMHLLWLMAILWVDYKRSVLIR